MFREHWRERLERFYFPSLSQKARKSRATPKRGEGYKGGKGAPSVALPNGTQNAARRPIDCQNRIGSSEGLFGVLFSVVIQCLQGSKPVEVGEAFDHLRLNWRNAEPRGQKVSPC
jgi:hypothetical protein